MPSNTDDEIYRSLARLMEQLLRSLPQAEPGQVVGFTIMTGTAPMDSQAYGFRDDEQGDIDYECVEGHDEVFVTARIPSDLRTAPYVDILPRMVRIVMDDRVTEIEMPAPIDVRHSHYQVRHGIMDIACRKQ
jgi:hypothetical protein